MGCLEGAKDYLSLRTHSKSQDCFPGKQILDSLPINCLNLSSVTSPISLIAFAHFSSINLINLLHDLGLEKPLLPLQTQFPSL